MVPVKNKELTYKQKMEALGYLMFLKGKGVVKPKVTGVETVTGNANLFQKRSQLLIQCQQRQYFSLL